MAGGFPSPEAERLDAMLGLVQMLSESAGGMRKSLIAQGFNETMAGVMAANFYGMMLRKIAEGDT